MTKTIWLPTQLEADKMIALREQGYRDSYISVQLGVTLKRVYIWFKYLQSQGIDVSKPKKQIAVPYIP